MKNTLIAFLLLLISNSALSQNDNSVNYYSPWNFSTNNSNFSPIYFDAPEYKKLVENKKTTDKRVEIGLVEKKITTKNKKGKIIVDGFQKYNSKGLLIDYKTKVSSQQLNYINDTLLLERKENVKGKKSSTLFIYEKQSFIVRKTNHKGIITKESITTYNENGKEISVIRKYGKKQTDVFEYKSFYNKEGKLVKSQNFHNKKLKQEWLYDCSEEGKIVKNKEVQQNSVCKWKEEKNDGSYINYTRNIYEKKTYLTKSEFNKDSVMISFHSFLNDTILNYSFEKIGNIEVEKKYNQKGKLNSIQTSIFNETKKIVHYEMVKIGFFNDIKINKYEYNSNNLLISSTSSNGRKETRKHFYKYDEKGSLVQYKYYENGKLKSISEHINIYK